LFSEHPNDDEDDERPFWGMHYNRTVEEHVEQAELSASLRHHLEVMPGDQRAAVVLIDVLRSFNIVQPGSPAEIRRNSLISKWFNLPIKRCRAGMHPPGTFFGNSSANCAREWHCT
jgi:hypothetical protein